MTYSQKLRNFRPFSICRTSRIWQKDWDHPQVWFSFGTIKINTDNRRKVIGFDFDVPNDDFFFEELKP